MQSQSKANRSREAICEATAKQIKRAERDGDFLEADGAIVKSEAKRTAFVTER